MATWSKENILSFIEEYRSHECLWKVKSKDYSNRLKREHAYEKIVAFVKSIEPEADKDFVIKKFNNLRNSFRKQLKKLDALKLSGSGADEVEPKLWYFNALEFLRDQEVPRLSLSNIEQDIAEEPTYIPLDVATDSPSPSSPADLPTPTSRSHSTTQQPTPTAAQGAGSSNSSSRPAKRKAAAVENELLTLAKSRLLGTNNVLEEDEFDTFSKTIGHKLRSMSRDQRVHVQMLISDVMYEAELGTLSRNTAIIHRMIHEQPQQPPPMTEVYHSYDAVQFH